MDVEKTMEFIRESQAKHESEIQVIRNLLKGGIKLFKTNQAKLNEKLAAIKEAQLRTDAQFARLAEAQAITERKRQSFLDSLKNPKNGI